MIKDGKKFITAIIMLIVFGGVYAYMMSPSFGNGRNGLEFADDMFNSISKGSVYNVMQTEINNDKQWNGHVINVTLTGTDATQADSWSSALQKVTGAEVNQDQEKVTFKGDFGALLANISEDCINMFNNNGDAVNQKYNADPREITNNWYIITKGMIKDLEIQESFKESIAMQQYQQKIIEPAYNYYGVEAKIASDNKGMMTFMMLFYLAYTIWYGFAIYFLFQGCGVSLSKGH